MKTLQDAKADWMYSINGDGEHRPCCGQFVKAFRGGGSSTNAAPSAPPS